MKRKRVRIAMAIGLLSVLVYFVPIWISSAKARPLYGDFDLDVRCMGGHEIFLHLDEDEAFDHCPGHRDMRSLGRIERSANSVTVRRKKDDAPLYRVDFKGGNHSLNFLRGSPPHDLPHVNNPWRTWLPRFLPEE